jgi:hypothetical protein
MFRDLSLNLGLDAMATAALIIFFLVFVIVATIIVTRPNKFVDRWARIPLDDTQPRKPQDKP